MLQNDLTLKLSHYLHTLSKCCWPQHLNLLSTVFILKQKWVVHQTYSDFKCPTTNDFPHWMYLFLGHALSYASPDNSFLQGCTFSLELSPNLQSKLGCYHQNCNNLLLSRSDLVVCLVLTRKRGKVKSSKDMVLPLQLAKTLDFPHQDLSNLQTQHMPAT